MRKSVPVYGFDPELGEDEDDQAAIGLGAMRPAHDCGLPGTIRTKPIPRTRLRGAGHRAPVHGEPSWIRTSDLLIKSQLLYQLSYGP